MAENKKRGEVRCDENPFHTLLFRYDWRGIWVYCRDCRVNGKRGKEHLITWGRLFGFFLEASAHNDKHGEGTGVDSNDAEG